MHTFRVVLPFFLFALASWPASADSTHQRRIRPLDAAVRALVDDGRARSAFFRSLLDLIERSDLIIYIRSTTSMPRGADGQLQLAAAAVGVRYLRIALQHNLPRDRGVGLLGHELMHAVEVARDRRVRDQASFRALYLRIGHSHDGVTFDTAEAVAAGNQVLAELKVRARPVTGR